MKNLYKTCTALIAGAAAMTVAATAGAMTLSFTDQSPNRGARAAATTWLTEEISKRTNGDIKIDIHWGGALMKAKAAPKGIGDGAADMGFIIGVYNPGMHPGYLIGDLPTEYSDPWTTTRALYELTANNKALQKEWDKLNLHYITNVTTGPIQLVCKDKDVKTLADIKGMKNRGISIYGKVFKDLGATPVSMSAYDTYQGLDTGLIDCTQMYGYAIPAFKLNEVSTSFTRLDWGALMSVAMVMNKNTWEALGPEKQKIINDLSSEFVDVYVEKIVDGNSKALEGLKSEGKVTMHDLSKSESNALLEASQPYVADWKEKAAKAGIDGDKLRAEYLALLKKYEAERQAKGYPWAR